MISKQHCTSIINNFDYISNFNTIKVNENVIIAVQSVDKYTTVKHFISFGIHIFTEVYNSESKELIYKVANYEINNITSKYINECFSKYFIMDVKNLQGKVTNVSYVFNKYRNHTFKVVPVKAYRIDVI